METSDSNISTIDILLGKELHAKEFDKLIVKIYDSSVQFFKMKDGKNITKQDLDESREWVASFGSKRYLNLIEAGIKTEIEDEMRSSSAQENNYTIADALVVKSLAQRMMTNLYLRFNKPQKPTKIFTDKEEALFWLMSFK